MRVRYIPVNIPEMRADTCSVGSSSTDTNQPRNFKLATKRLRRECLHALETMALNQMFIQPDPIVQQLLWSADLHRKIAKRFPRIIPVVTNPIWPSEIDNEMRFEFDYPVEARAEHIDRVFAERIGSHRNA